jgi:hypothetical protein
MRVALNAARRAQQESALEFARATRGRGSAAMGGPSAFPFRVGAAGRGTRGSRRGVGGGVSARTRRPNPATRPRPSSARRKGSARVVTHQGLTAVGTARPASASLGYPGVPVPGGASSSSGPGRASNASSSTIRDPASRRRLGRCSGTSASRKRAPSRTTPTRTRRRRTTASPGRVTRAPEAARRRARRRAIARGRSRRAPRARPSAAPRGGGGTTACPSRGGP